MRKTITLLALSMLINFYGFGQNVNDFTYTKKKVNLMAIVNEYIPRKIENGKDVYFITLKNSHFLRVKPEDVIAEREYIEITEFNGTANNIQIPNEIEGLPVMGIYYIAFYGKKLTSVSIPNGVAYIKSGAFADNNLTSVIIPNSVRAIGSAGSPPGAFAKNRLTSVTIPDSVIVLGGFDQNQLTNINIPNSVIYIGDNAFTSNKLTNIIIPNSVIYIGNNAFADNKITNVSIPNSVTNIEVNAFFRNQLTNITIPNSVSSIGFNAFKENKINTITIGANVKTEESFDNGFDEIYVMNNKKAGTYIFNNGNWTIQGQRIINPAQSSVLSISWDHGDTIETLRRKNPNHNFRLENDGSAKSYKVIEGREPTITETTFIFGPDSRLVTIIYRKVGAALDIYGPLFQRYKTIYGNPKENNEFGINQNQTRINGFYVFTGNSSFENSKGSVSLMVVASESKNLPYVFFTESYKY